ncbi:hypothetical protein NDU88_002852 [Pleurodeles waltl]|uniref:Uncharacterized protein n=1 Tax=Pleurodeles waltl TaxID=8319 RepID=A0AAV7M4K9_PLEWA|nr:hypothetical protein NDU88_002852 [Pleurodeles waltl]
MGIETVPLLCQFTAAALHSATDVGPQRTSVDGAPVGTVESPDVADEKALSLANLMVTIQGACTELAHKIDSVAIDVNLLCIDLQKVAE